MQGEGVANAKVIYTGPAHALRTIAAKEGMRGLYRGLAPAIMFQMVGNSTRFGVYYAGKGYLGKDKELDGTTNIGLALTAGALAGLIACPFFVLKTQLQVQSSVAEIATGHQHQHKGVVHAARSIFRAQGVSGLYAGLPVFTWRCIALVGAQMTSYDWAKHKIIESKYIGNGPACHMMSSAVSAGAACVCMQVTCPSSEVSVRT
jgi:solute carrier family 25 protein 34/35